jgi:hypothetical protein
VIISWIAHTHGKRSGALVHNSIEDLELVVSHSWHLDENGYVCAMVRTGGRVCRKRMHRMLLNLTDSKVQADHRNRVRSDNRRENLRIATNALNAQNSTYAKPRKQHPTTAPTVRGVTWVGHHRGHAVTQWRAQGMIHGVPSSRYFATQAEAIKWVAQYRATHHPFAERQGYRGSENLRSLSVDQRRSHTRLKKKSKELGE